MKEKKNESFCAKQHGRLVYQKKKTWTFKFTVLKNKLGKNKLFIEKN